jgi:hypothetical protein
MSRRAGLPHVFRTTHLHFTRKGRSTPERTGPLACEISGRMMAGFDESGARQPLLQRLLRPESNSRAASVADGTRWTINGGRHAG